MQASRLSQLSWWSGPIRQELPSDAHQGSKLVSFAPSSPETQWKVSHIGRPVLFIALAISVVRLSRTGIVRRSGCEWSVHQSSLT